MKKIIEKVKFAALVAADMVLLLVALGVEAAARHVSDPFKHPKY